MIEINSVILKKIESYSKDIQTVAHQALSICSKEMPSQAIVEYLEGVIKQIVKKNRE